MDKPDARHLTIETQTYLRQQAIRLRLRGKRVCDIGEYLGFAEKLNRNLRDYPTAQTWSVGPFLWSRIFSQSLLNVSVKGLTSA